MENARYHVLLEGRRVGPYDRRTIVGMRIKKALTSADVLVTAEGGQLTVGAENVVTRGRNPFSPRGENGEDEGTVPYVRYEQDL